MGVLLGASIDPLLSNEDLPRRRRGKDVSMKLQHLDEVVEREIREKNGKLLVFSDLKTGVIDELVEKYANLGAIKVTGDTSTEIGGIRENLRRKFQNDPNCRMLFLTTTMNEGADLTAATAVYNLTIPWTPNAYHQRYKRTHRLGEKKKDSVNVYVPYTTIQGSQPSIEEAKLVMLDGKERMSNYLLSGIQISKEDLREWDEPRKTPGIRKAIESPNKTIFQYYLKWRGVGKESALRRLNKAQKTAKYIAEKYPKFNMTQNAANIYVPIIKKLEKRKKLENKVDIACGPGMLGHFLGEPTVGIDINHEMLKVGKTFYKDNKLAVGSMDSIPLKSKYADLVVCSLAYQMTEPKQERAKALQEMSRILKRRGYVIITLPGKYLNSRDHTKFEKALDAYGFDIKDHQRNLTSSGIEIYVLQKVHEPEDRIYNLKFKGDPDGAYGKRKRPRKNKKILCK